VRRLEEGAQAERGGRRMLGDVDELRPDAGVDHLIVGHDVAGGADLAGEAAAGFGIARELLGLAAVQGDRQCWNQPPETPHGTPPPDHRRDAAIAGASRQETGPPAAAETSRVRNLA
jgi:hypothetical protein